MIVRASRVMWAAASTAEMALSANWFFWAEASQTRTWSTISSWVSPVKLRVAMGPDATFRPVTGLGTVINIAAVLLGSVIGVVIGHRLPQQWRTTLLHGLWMISLIDRK